MSVIGMRAYVSGRRCADLAPWDLMYGRLPQKERAMLRGPFSILSDRQVSAPGAPSHHPSRNAFLEASARGCT